MLIIAMHVTLWNIALTYITYTIYVISINTIDGDSWS